MDLSFHVLLNFWSTTTSLGMGLAIACCVVIVKDLWSLSNAGCRSKDAGSRMPAGERFGGFIIIFCCPLILPHSFASVFFICEAIRREMNLLVL
jgi:hypothetical protein